MSVKVCKKCGQVTSSVAMVGKKCYLCTLGEFPPKTNKQLIKYEKAVAIRMCLVTPLTKVQGLKVTKMVGLEKLDVLQEVVEGKIVDHKPGATFYQRAHTYLEATCGK